MRLDTAVPAVQPAMYPLATRLRVDVLADLLDRLTVDHDAPVLSAQLGLMVGEIAGQIDTACANSAQGTNVVPHLLATLDAIGAELGAVMRKAGGPVAPPSVMHKVLRSGRIAHVHEDDPRVFVNGEAIGNVTPRTGGDGWRVMLHQWAYSERHADAHAAKVAALELLS